MLFFGRAVLYEPVAHAANRLDVPGEGAKLLTQVFDVCIDGSLRDHHGILPDRLEELLARERLARMPDEVAEQLELGQRKPEVFVVERCPVFILEDGEVVNLQNAAFFDTRAPKNGLYVGDNDLRRNRLGEIVVGAEHQTAHRVFFLCLRTEEDDRDGFRLNSRADLSAHIISVEVRHHHVQHHQVGVAVNLRKCLLTVVRGVDVVSFLTKEMTYDLDDVLLVVNYHNVDVGRIRRCDHYLSAIGVTGKLIRSAAPYLLTGAPKDPHGDTAALYVGILVCECVDILDAFCTGERAG